MILYPPWLPTRFSLSFSGFPWGADPACPRGRKLGLISAPSLSRTEVSRQPPGTGPVVRTLLEVWKSSCTRAVRCEKLTTCLPCAPVTFHQSGCKRASPAGPAVGTGPELGLIPVPQQPGGCHGARGGLGIARQRGRRELEAHIGSSSLASEQCSPGSYIFHSS